MTRPVLPMDQHKAQAAARNARKNRKPVRLRGRRALEWQRFRLALLRKVYFCQECGAYIFPQIAQVAHLLPRSLAPDLVCVRENCVVICAHHRQTEDEVGDSRTRLAILRDRYGADRAEWAEREMRARGLIKT